MKNKNLKMFLILPIILWGGYFICAPKEARAASPTIHSVSAGGNWSDPNTWDEKRVPKEGDIVAINGTVDYSDIIGIGGLIVNPGAVLQSAPNYNYYTLTINGDAVNNGTIRDGYNYFLINISGSIYNNGVWNNFRTALFSTEPRIIGGLNPLAGYDVVFNNSFEILNSPVFAGGVNFNNQTIALYSSDQNITLLGNMNSPVTISGQGSLIAGPGADISGNINVKKIIFDAGNQSIGQANIAADQIILRGPGLKEVWGYPAVINGRLIIDEGAVLQNIPNYNYVLIINGDVVNNGLIRDNPSNYYYLNMSISGNIINNSSWTNSRTALTWNPVLGFEKYLFNISAKQSAWPEPIELYSNSYDVSNILNDTSYWRVSAKISGYYTPWSETRTINGRDAQSVLSYSSEDGYAQDAVSQGVNPNKGVASSSEFIFKLIYSNTDNKAPDKTEVVIIGEKNIDVYAMASDIDTDIPIDLRDGDYGNGEQYVFSGIFPQGKYEYYFRAANGGEEITLPDAGKLGFESGYSNIVFLPGIKGSRLYTPGAFFENQLWEPNRNADVEKLFLDENGDSINPDVYTRDVIDEVDIIGTNIYKTFLESLDNMASEKIINEKFIMPYDWRLGIPEIIGGAVKTDAGGYSMIDEIEKLASSSQSGKVIIIAHSTGGLVAKSLINSLSDLNEADLVDKLILVAVPQAGTPEAIVGMLHGDKQDLGLGIILSNKTARIFTENMKSAYSLLPSSRYFEIAEGPVIKLDESSSLLEKMRNFYGNEINSMSGLAQFLAGAEGRIKPDAADINTPYVLPSSFIEEAGAFHKTVDSWSAPEGVEVIQIAGWGLDTISGIRYSEKYVSAACDPKAKYCPQVLTYAREPIFSKDGDEVVMLPSATEMGDAKTFYVNIKQYNNFLNKKNRHPNILEIESVKELLEDEITYSTKVLPPYIYKDKQGLGVNDKRLRASVHSPVSLDIYDSSGFHTGLMENPDPESDIEYVEETIPNSYYLAFGDEKYIGAASENAYRLELKGLGYGDFTLKITEVSDEGETTLVYENIPATPDTKASIAVKSLEEIGALKIDMDGDGQIDMEINSPEETKNPSVYIDMIELSIENMNLDKHIEKYLMTKFDVIKKHVEKGNLKPAQAIIGQLEKYVKEKTEKFIPHKDAQIILNLISNLNNLMVK